MTTLFPDIDSHWVALLSGIVTTAFSQIILKKGVIRESSFLLSFINVRTFIGYILLGTVTVLNVYAMQKIQLKTATAWIGISFALVPIFSRVILKEHMDLRKAIGCMLVFLGIAVFTL